MRRHARACPAIHRPFPAFPRPSGSLDEQQRQITLYAELKQLTLTTTATEDGVSGSIPFGQRPEGKALLARLRPGDALIASKLDRMFRDAADANETVHLLHRRGVILHLIDLGGNVSDGPIGQLLLTIMAAIAEFERARIAERTAESKAQQRLQGTFLGGLRPFGHLVAEREPDSDTPRKLHVNAEEQAAMAEILDAAARGVSLRRIQADLNGRGIRISRGTIANVINRAKAAQGEDR
jgi:putative DNA-invertase from lambdoid prophage Rac